VVKEVTLMRHKDRSMAKLSSSGKSRVQGGHLEP
jgi:hypothetical protein